MATLSPLVPPPGGASASRVAPGPGPLARAVALGLALLGFGCAGPLRTEPLPSSPEALRLEEQRLAARLLGDPADERAAVRLAAVRLAQDRPDDALLAVRAAGEVRPVRPEPAWLLVEAALRAGLPRAALGTLDALQAAGVPFTGRPWLAPALQRQVEAALAESDAATAERWLGFLGATEALATAELRRLQFRVALTLGDAAADDRRQSSADAAYVKALALANADAERRDVVYRRAKAAAAAGAEEIAGSFFEEYVRLAGPQAEEQRQAWLAVADYYERDYRAAEADAACAKAAALGAFDPALALRRAELCLKRRDVGCAEPLLQAALAAAADGAARFSLAMQAGALLDRFSATAPALEWYAAAGRERPTSIEPVAAAARLRARTGAADAVEPALRAFVQGAGGTPDAVLAAGEVLETLQFDAAAAELYRGHAALASQEPRLLLRAGLVAGRQGKAAERDRAFAAYVAAAPQRPMALRDVGLALLTFGAHARAEGLLVEALAALPADLDVALALAEVYRLTRRSQDEEAVLTRFADAAGPAAEATFRVGERFVRVGRAAAARPFLERHAAAAGAPRAADAHRLLAELDLRDGVGSAARARDHFLAYARLSPDPAAALDEVRRTLASQPAFKPYLIDVLEQLVPLRPDDPALVLELVDLLLDARRPAHALRWLQRFVAGAADRGRAARQAVQALLRKQRTPQALALIADLGDVDLGEPDLHRRVGEVLARRGELQRARFHLRRALFAEGAAPESLRPLADSLLNLGLPDLALEAYRRLAKPVSERPDVQVAIGRCYLEMRRYAEADAAFDAYLARESKSGFGPTRRIAELYRQAGQVRRSVALLERVFEPPHARYVSSVFDALADGYARLGIPERIAPLAARLVAEAPKRAPALRIAASTLARFGQYGEAARLLVALRNESPGDFDVVRALIAVLIAQQDHDGALRELQRYVRLRGRSADVRLAASRLLAEHALDTQALAVLDEAAADGQATAEHYLLRAELLLRAGRLRDAEADFGTALQRAESLSAVLKVIRRLCLRAGQPGMLANLYRLAEGLAPASADQALARTDMLFRAGRLAEAEGSLAELLARPERVLSAAAKLLLRRQDYARAAGLLERAVQVAPEKEAREALLELSELLSFGGERERLLAAVEHHLATARERPEALLAAATAMERAGRPADALRYTAEANRLRPSPEGLHAEARLRYALGEPDRALDKFLAALREAGRRLPFGVQLEAERPSALALLADIVGFLGERGDGPRLLSLVERASTLVGRDEARLRALLLGEHLRQGRLAEAVAALAELARDADDNERDAQALREAVAAFSDRGFVAEAADVLADALEPSGSPAAARLLIALDLRLGRPSDAAAQAERLLQNSARPQEERLRVGEAYLEGGDAAEAVRFMAPALPHVEFDRAEELAAALGAYGRALSEAGLGEQLPARWADALRDRDDQRLADEALWMAAAEAQRYDLAGAALDRLLLVAPGAAELRRARLRVAVLSGDMPTAEAQAQLRVRHATSPLQGWQEVLATLERVPGSDVGLDAAERVVELDRGDPKSLRAAAVLAFRRGQERRGQAYLERLVSLQTDAGSAALDAAELCVDAFAHGCARRWLERADGANPGASDPNGALRAAQLRVRMALREEDAAGARAAVDGAVAAAPAAAAFVRVEAAATLLLHPGRAARFGELLAEWADAALLERPYLPGALLAGAAASILQPKRGDARAAIDGFAQAAFGRREGLSLLGRLALQVRQPALATHAWQRLEAAEGPVVRHEAVLSAVRDLTDREPLLTAAERDMLAPLALPAIQGLLDRNPTDLRDVTWHADLLEKLGDVRGAEEVYRTAMERAPRMSAFPNNLAYLFARRGERLDEALQLVRRARTLDPGQSAFYLDTEGWIDFQAGRLGDAERKVRASLRLAALDPELELAESLLHLGHILQKRAARTEAEDAFRLAVTLEPTGPVGDGALAALRALGVDPFRRGAANPPAGPAAAAP